MPALSGGANLKKRLAQLSKQVAQPASVEVGFLEGATYPDGTSVPMVAAIQEFGAPGAGIPPRPYFRTMIKEHEGEWGDDVAQLLEAHDFDAAKVMELMGDLIAGQLRDSIIALMAPPLSPVTLMLRKMRAEDPSLKVTGRVVGQAAELVKAGADYSGVSTKPLVDSGHLLNSVDYKVTQS